MERPRNERWFEAKDGGWDTVGSGLFDRGETVIGQRLQFCRTNPLPAKERRK